MRHYSKRNQLIPVTAALLLLFPVAAQAQLKPVMGGVKAVRQTTSVARGGVEGTSRISQVVTNAAERATLRVPKVHATVPQTPGMVHNTGTGTVTSTQPINPNLKPQALNTFLKKAASKGGSSAEMLHAMEDAMKQGKEAVWGPEYLEQAVEDGDLAAIDFWANFGENVNGITSNGKTLLNLAVETQNLKTVKRMVQHGAKVSTETLDWLPEAFSYDLEPIRNIVKYLAQNGAVNAVDEQGVTLLHRAAWNGDFELVKFLVENNANVNQLTLKGESPLQYVGKGGNTALSMKTKIKNYLIKNGAK